MTQHQQQIWSNIASEVQSRMQHDASGHDWFHVERVVALAQHLARHENADLFVVSLTALLHDIADHKFHGGDREIGSRVAREILHTYHVPEEIITIVCDLIPKISFSGSQGERNMTSIEGMCVQDADRLDAIGAIGIGRAFAYGGTKGRPLYHPEDPNNTLQHFTDKLLRLSELMNTTTARAIAKKRHAVLEEFQAQFLREWHGTDYTESTQ